ncbi:MAG: hypothetical protein ACREJO_14420 [Phycisphaerales bacterium]
MHPKLPAPVLGATKRDQAIHAAGAIAEAGILDLTLRTPSGPQPLLARTTDLPGQLAAALHGSSLRTLDESLRIDISDHALMVMRADSTLAARLAGAAPHPQPNKYPQ